MTDRPTLERALTAELRRCAASARPPHDGWERLLEAHPELRSAGEAAPPRSRVDIGQVGVRRPGVRAALVAAAIVAALFVGGVLAWDGGGRSQSIEILPAGEPPSSPVELASAYVDALARHDAPQAASYLTSDGLETVYGGLQMLEHELAWQEAIGWEVIAGTCERRDRSADAVVVRCPYAVQALGSAELDLGPIADNHFDLTIDEGRITDQETVGGVVAPDGGLARRLSRFGEWLAITHSDSVDAMYADRDRTRAALSDESIDLWRQHVREYLLAEFSEVGLTTVSSQATGSSSSEPSELITEYWVPRHGYLFSGAVRLYADGRLIWRQLFPDNVWSSSTGWVQQRLTPEGVRLVGTETDNARRDPTRLAEWLPATAWHDRTVRTFVASGWAACEHSDPQLGEAPIDGGLHQQLLDQLPVAAADRLRGLDPVEGTYDGLGRRCVALTDADADEFVRILAEAGIDQEMGWPVTLYEFEHPGGDGPDARVALFIEPVFPDGTVSCSGCG